MARRSQLEGRLLAILDSSQDHGTSARVSPLVAALLAIGLIAPLAAVHAQSNTTQTPASALSASNSFQAMIQSGDVARERRDFSQAKMLYTKALTAVKSASETATAQIRLGIVELGNKNATQAMDDFEQARRADSAQTSEAVMWMAIAQRNQNNLEAADGLFQSALAAENLDSAAAATTLELYAVLLRQEGKQDEANKMQVQADTVRKAEEAQAVATSHASGPDVYTIGGDVKSPVLLSKLEPKYTEEARIAKYQGTSFLAVEIAADGTVRNVQVLRPLAFGLSEKAIEAVSKWKFKPGTKDGQPVAVSAHVEINFRLL
jgi:TonB family protein